MNNKLCTKCKETKPLSAFGIDKRGLFEKRSRCKSCVYRYAASRIKINRTKLHMRSVQSRASRGRLMRMRALDKNRPGITMTLAEYRALISAPCSYCGVVPVPGVTIGADRLDNALAHTLANCVPACDICNCTRGAIFTVEEMKTLGLAIAGIRAAREAVGQPPLRRRWK